jgi:hypothetical protein
LNAFSSCAEIRPAEVSLQFVKPAAAMSAGFFVLACSCQSGVKLTASGVTGK